VRHAIRVVAVPLTALSLATASCKPAEALESFTLRPQDRIVAEARGCRVECTPTAASQRTCIVRELGCRAVCIPLPECRPDGTHVLQACAIVRDRP
jgi:hypothetical protein